MDEIFMILLRKKIEQGEILLEAIPQELRGQVSDN